jgi:molybdopterin converting factor small subunit
MKIKIQFFGPLTEICNLNEFDLDGDPDTNKLLERLKEMYPAFNTAVFAVAVNNQLVQENLP